MEENLRENNTTLYAMSQPGGANSSMEGGEGYEAVYVYDMWYRVRTILSMPTNIMALILGTVAITMNLLSILVISRLCHSQLTSHFRLILNLAISDVLIGASLLMFTIINAFVQIYPPGLGPPGKRLTSRCLFCFSKAVNTTGLAITLLNLMGMAIDHYIAIMRPLHYAVMLSRERSVFMISVLWVVAILCGFSDFMSAFPKYTKYRHKYNFCEFIHLTKYHEEYSLFVIAFICLISMLFTYIKIYMEVKKHQARTPQLSPDLIKNKKAIITTLLILGTFILCWMPMCIYSVVLTILVSVNEELVLAKRAVLYKVDQYLFVLLLLNAIADPIIYAARVKEVQHGYKRLFCRRRLRRRRSNASYEVSQYTTFMDLPRKSSRGSSSLIFDKHGVSQSAMPMLKAPDISVISPQE